MKMRIVVALLAGASVACGACLEGFELFTTTSATSTNSDDQSNEEGSDTLLITGAVLLGLSVAGTVTGFTEGDGDFSYLQEHQQEVRVALARGEGPFITDIAQRLALPAPLLPHLGAALQAARPLLDPPLDAGPVDRARAETFSRELVRVIAEDPVLAPWLEDHLTIATSN